MSDIFKDMQMKTGCEYISDLPSHKRIVWKELKKQKTVRGFFQLCVWVIL